MNLPASRLPCRPVIHLNLDCMSLWPSGLQGAKDAGVGWGRFGRGNRNADHAESERRKAKANVLGEEKV